MGNIPVPKVTQIIQKTEDLTEPCFTGRKKVFTGFSSSDLLNALSSDCAEFIRKPYYNFVYINYLIKFIKWIKEITSY